VNGSALASMPLFGTLEFGQFATSYVGERASELRQSGVRPKLAE